MTTTPAQTKQRKSLTATRLGVVTSAKRDKTRTVMVSYLVRHSKYGKILKRQTKYQVHDESNQSKLGDRVEIANCRPISKTKSWRLVKVVESAAVLLEHKTEVETA